MLYTSTYMHVLFILVECIQYAHNYLHKCTYACSAQDSCYMYMNMHNSYIHACTYMYMYSYVLYM